MNIIETKNLTKGSGGQMRVSKLDLAIPEGCVYGFLGPAEPFIHPQAYRQPD